MVDDRGKVLPDRFFKFFGLTKAKPHRGVKRRGKWYILSLDAYESNDIVAWAQKDAPGYTINGKVEEWLNHHLGSNWSFKTSVWYDDNCEYDREFLDIRFPDLQSLTLFKMVWLGFQGD